jgi:glycosyltransferase involved in cell wall biosynthesis
MFTSGRRQFVVRHRKRYELVRRSAHFDNGHTEKLIIRTQGGTTRVPSHEPIRVALFTETFLPKLDGIVRILCLTLDHLKRIGAEAIVFAPGEHVASYAGFPVHSIPGVTFPLYPELTLALPGKRTRDIIEDFDPTLVHVLNPTISGIRGMQFARSLDKPLVASFHANIMEGAAHYGLGFLKTPLWHYHRLIYNQADHILATSKHMVSELEAHGFNNVGLWRRGVHAGRFSPDFASRDMRDRISGGNADQTLLLYVGRLAPEKQIHQIAPILDAIPGTHLALVGDGPYRSKLEEIFAGKSVTFNGYMTGETLSAAYASADIFVFPSSMFETFGLVVAEAMAAGLPVVSSRVGGVPEIITHGENGYMVEVDDIGAMIEHVRLLANDADRRAAFGELARKAVAPLTWTAIMDELFEVYREVIDEYEATRAA